MTDNTVAKIAKGALVVSLKNAKTPTVWRARLESLDEASFRIDTAGKGAYSLNLRRAGGKAGGEEVAVFATKTAAEQALSTITDVLFNMEDMAAEPPESDETLAAPVKTTADPAPATAPRAADSVRSMTGCRVFYWLSFALIFMVLVAFVYKGSATYSLANSGGVPLPDMPNSQTMGGDIEEMPDLPEGRLRSADDFFQERESR